MDIHSPPGTKVRFTNSGGYEIQRVTAALMLSVDDIYTVEHIKIQNWMSYVWLREVPGHSFNTVMFETVEKLVQDELLEACRAALVCIERHAPATEFAPREMLRAAIAKAEEE